MMTKGIDVPSHIRDVVEGVLEPPQSHRHLIDEVLIVHVGLIRHAPTAVDELQLFVSYKCLHPALLLVGGLVPPPVEEGHFDNDELVLGVLCEFSDHRVDDILHSCELNVVFGSVVILIDCFEPSDVIMGVWDQMHCYMLRHFSDCIVIR